MANVAVLSGGLSPLWSEEHLRGWRRHPCSLVRPTRETPLRGTPGVYGGLGRPAGSLRLPESRSSAWRLRVAPERLTGASGPPAVNSRSKGAVTGAFGAGSTLGDRAKVGIVQGQSGAAVWFKTHSAALVADGLSSQLSPFHQATRPLPSDSGYQPAGAA